MSVQRLLYYNFSLIQLTFRIVMLHEWMNEWMNECVNEWMSVQCVLHYNLCNSAYISNCHVTWMNEWVNEWMNECLFSVYYNIISI